MKSSAFSHPTRGFGVFSPIRLHYVAKKDCRGSIIQDFQEWFKQCHMRSCFRQEDGTSVHFSFTTLYSGEKKHDNEIQSTVIPATTLSSFG